jgi:hypothetical protein
MVETYTGKTCTINAFYRSLDEAFYLTVLGYEESNLTIFAPAKIEEFLYSVEFHGESYITLFIKRKYIENATNQEHWVYLKIDNDYSPSIEKKLRLWLTKHSLFTKIYG